MKSLVWIIIILTITVLPIFFFNACDEEEDEEENGSCIDDDNADDDTADDDSSDDDASSDCDATTLISCMNDCVVSTSYDPGEYPSCASACDWTIPSGCDSNCWDDCKLDYNECIAGVTGKSSIETCIHDFDTCITGC